VTVVLIADDDQALTTALTTLLEASGYEVRSAATTDEVLNLWPRAHPDLLVVDLHMPGDGLELVRKVREESSVPMLVLSADHREEMKVAALDAGADDYVEKPFAAAELLARVRASLRRGGIVGEFVTVGRLILDAAVRSASIGDQTVSLTTTEYDVLKLLASSDSFFPTEDILHRVWGPNYQDEREYVRAYIRRIRAKLTELGGAAEIESKPGLGYRLTVG
jgi:two-component system KDP operon response regulator KdpE